MIKMEKGWDDIWHHHTKLNWFGRRLKSSQRKILLKVLNKIKLEKNSKIIDIGCGTGSMINFFREFGYKNSVGIDASEESLKVCSKLFGYKKNKDVFQMDARKIKFGAKSFNLVFSDGMLEHLPSLDKALSEFARISKKYILLFQPNQTSVFGRVKEFASKHHHVSWEKEYEYSKEDYVKPLEKKGFKLIGSGSINFNEMIWLLFEKSN